MRTLYEPAGWHHGDERSPGHDIPPWLLIAGVVVLAAGSVLLLRYASDVLVLAAALGLLGFLNRVVSDWLSEAGSVSAWALGAVTLSLFVMVTSGFWVVQGRYPGEHRLHAWTPSSVSDGLAWAERRGWAQRVDLPPRVPGPATVIAPGAPALASRGAGPEAVPTGRLQGASSDANGPRAGTTAPTPTTTTLAISARNVSLGAPVRLSVDVRSAGRSPGSWHGTVTFSRDGTVIGSAPVRGQGAHAAASITVRTLPAGSHAITAVYSGSDDHAPSSSTVVRIAIAR